jgi:hypothetical protein
MKRFWIAVVFILAAAFSRLLPHPPNVAPIAAMALAGGVYFDKRFAVAVPLLALLLSDVFLGFYSLMIFVYGSFLAIGFLGMWLKTRKSPLTVFGAALAGSVLFFVVTNFGVWLLGHSVYPRSLAGLLECYTLAIPFFRNTLVGDLAYTAVLFGLFEILDRYIVPSKVSEKAV